MVSGLPTRILWGFKLSEENKNIAHVSINIHDDATVMIGLDGSPIIKSEREIFLKNFNLVAVALSNILDLKSYGMTINEERTMHLIEFNNGGRFELSFNANGEIESCFGEFISVLIKDGDKLTISQLT